MNARYTTTGEITVTGCQLRVPGEMRENLLEWTGGDIAQIGFAFWSYFEDLWALDALPWAIRLLGYDDRGVYVQRCEPRA